MDLWDLKGTRTLSWTAEIESVFAIYCRKHRFDFKKVSHAMRRYVLMNGNDAQTRLVDPFMFTPDVCRVHWSFRDYKKRKAAEEVSMSRAEIYVEEPVVGNSEAFTSEAVSEDDDSAEKQMKLFMELEGNDGDDPDAMMKKLDRLVSHVSGIMSKDKTQPVETPTFADLKRLCSTDEKEDSERKQIARKVEDSKILSEPESGGVSGEEASKPNKTKAEGEQVVDSRAQAARLRRKQREERQQAQNSSQ